MEYNKNYLDQYKFKIAYPTIALTVVAISIYTVVSIAAVQGYLGMSWTIAVNGHSFQ